MASLHTWMQQQLTENQVEPNSGLGQALCYMLKHWEALTLFLRQAGAPLDNNLVSVLSASVYEVG
jgi:transposase